eukprot:m51a1_g11929 putative nuclear rna export factor 1 (739) ;mRNA; f:692123-696445
MSGYKRGGRGGNRYDRLSSDADGGHQHRTAVTSKGNDFGKRKGKEQHVDLPFKVMVTGMPREYNVDKMRSFFLGKLKENGRTDIRIVDGAVQVVGGSVWIGVRLSDHAAELARVLNGVPCGKSTITARAEDKSAKEELKDVVSRLVAANYKAASDALDLSNFSEKSGGRLNLCKVDTARFVMEQVSKSLPSLSYLSLDNNSLETMQPFTSLAKWCPTLQVLYLKGNLFESAKELTPIKNLSLVWLGVDGNPFTKKDKSVWIDELKKLFPHLCKIDDDDVSSPFRFNLPPHLTSPAVPRVLGGHAPTPEIGGFAEMFVRGFFKLVDEQNAEALMQVYTDRSLLTVSLYDTAVSLLKYTHENRNLAKAREMSKGTAGVDVGKTGSFKIVTLLSKDIPKSEHSLDDQTIIDVVQALTGSSTQLLTVCVYGAVRFPGNDVTKDYSFVRRFLLETKDNALGAVIVNDQLTLSGYLGRNPALQALAPPPAAPVVNTTLDPIATPEGQQMCSKLQQATGLTPEFTVQCLQNNGWNYDRAMANFQELNSRGQIPPQAFGTTLTFLWGTHARLGSASPIGVVCADTLARIARLALPLVGSARPYTLMGLERGETVARVRNYLDDYTQSRYRSAKLLLRVTEQRLRDGQCNGPLLLCRKDDGFIIDELFRPPLLGAGGSLPPDVYAYEECTPGRENEQDVVMVLIESYCERLTPAVEPRDCGVPFAAFSAPMQQGASDVVESGDRISA